MMVPTIHLNGTSKQSLLEDLGAAYSALDEAYNKLRLAAPNGRDYYPQGPTAINAAVEEHNKRLKKVDDVMKELHSLMEKICEKE